MSLVHGKTPEGEVTNDNPILIGAKDSDGKIYGLQVDEDGFLRVVTTIDTVSITNVDGKDAEGADVTGKPLTIGYKNATGKATGITPTNRLPVDARLSGSNMELYGATVAARPLATAVTTGAIFMAINTQEIWQSNGTDWVVI